MFCLIIFISCTKQTNSQENNTKVNDNELWNGIGFDTPEDEAKNIIIRNCSARDMTDEYLFKSYDDYSLVIFGCQKHKMKTPYFTYNFHSNLPSYDYRNGFYNIGLICSEGIARAVEINWATTLEDLINITSDTFGQYEIIESETAFGATVNNYIWKTPKKIISINNVVLLTMIIVDRNWYENNLTEVVPTLDRDQINSGIVF